MFSIDIAYVSYISCSYIFISEGGLSHVIPYKSQQKDLNQDLTVQLDEINYKEPKGATLMRMKELLYNFGRCDMFCDDHAIPIPPRTVFLSDIVEDDLDQLSEVIFNPMLMTPSTDYSTVFTTLKRMKEQINSLEQTHCQYVNTMLLLVLQQQQNLGRRFCTSKIHLSPPVA